MFKARLLRTTYWINDYLHGSPVGSEYRSIKRYFQNRLDNSDRLDAILSFAVENCQFYHGCDPLKLSSFPVVNKNILNENKDKISVKMEKIPGQHGELHIQKTSGSTGTPFSISQDTIKRNRRIAELKYFGEIVGFKSHDPLLQLRIWTSWQSKSKTRAFRENIHPFNIADMSDDNLAKLCDTINKYHITTIRSYASSYRIIADFVKRNNINLPSLKLCIAGSEALEEDVREAIKKYLKCDIISQYADEECGILAQEKIDGKPNSFYLNHASYVFEVLKMDSDVPAEYGELGRVVITDLTNRSFPIIRYDTGDIAVLHAPDETSDGKEYFSALYGRKIDLIFNTKGHPMHPMILSRVLKNVPNIRQWQFIQKSENGYLLKLNVSGMIDETEITKELKNYFGADAIISIEYVDTIPVLKSGKRRAVVNECHNHMK